MNQFQSELQEIKTTLSFISAVLSDRIPKRYLDAKELREELNISESSLRRLVSKKILIPYTLTGKLYFKREDVYTALEEGKLN